MVVAPEDDETACSVLLQRVRGAQVVLSPLVFRIRRNVQTDGKNGVQVEVQARVTNDEARDRETASYAYDLLERLSSRAAKGTASHFAREIVSPSAAKPMPIKSRTTSATEGNPVPAVITKIDRMKTRQGESLFLKVDVGGETVRVSAVLRNWPSVWKRAVTTFRRARSKPDWNSTFLAWLSPVRAKAGTRSSRNSCPKLPDGDESTISSQRGNRLSDSHFPPPQAPFPNHKSEVSHAHANAGRRFCLPTSRLSGNALRPKPRTMPQSFADSRLR